MPQIIYTARAYQDFERLKNFLLEAAPDKVGEAMTVIFDKLDILQNTPLAGTAIPCEAIAPLRKLVIPYGKSGYIALYKYDKASEHIVIETIRHMRELEPEFLRLR